MEYSSDKERKDANNKKIRAARGRLRSRKTKKIQNHDPTNIYIVVRVSDKRRDLDNCVSTILDALVKAGFLADDRLSQIGGILAKAVKVEKGQEGFDVIMPIKEIH